nr:PepSY domain-containing protein [Parahaliea mediterranea]
MGIGMCLLMAMWFFTGVVMMYVGFPALSVSERLQGLPVLEPAQLRVPVSRLLERLPPEGEVVSLRLTTVLERPAYVLLDGSGNRHVLFADNGEWLGEVGARQALRAAAQFAASHGLALAPGARAESLAMDQWTVSSSLHGHRPLYRVPLADAAGTELYVSSRTAEVVRDTTSRERVWNWLGANLHWLYPMQLRRHPTLWHWVIVVLSIIGLVSIVTGGIVGVQRLRIRRRYRGRDITPYRGMMKWHHILGLVTLVFLLTFMLSGLLSMNPFGVFSARQPGVDVKRALTGGTTVADHRRDVPAMAHLHGALSRGEPVREVRWLRLGGRGYQVLIADAHRYRALLPPDWPADATPADLARRAITASLPPGAVVDARELQHYDNYYYSHHQRWRPLPVLRMRTSGPLGSWFYIDASTGELLQWTTTKNRVQRWLYHGLHSLDFAFLINRRPLWDAVVIALSALGMALSGSSVIVAWRRLRPRRAP